MIAKIFMALKEASGNIDKCVDLLAHEPNMVVMSGEDAINYPILSNGGKGVISVTSIYCQIIQLDLLILH